MTILFPVTEQLNIPLLQSSQVYISSWNFLKKLGCFFFGVDLEILLPVKLFFVKVFDQQGKSYVASLRNRTVDVNITTFGGIGNAHFLNQAVAFFWKHNRTHKLQSELKVWIFASYYLHPWVIKHPPNPNSQRHKYSFMLLGYKSSSYKFLHHAFHLGYSYLLHPTL